MVKTTIYLPDDLKRKLERLAAETGRSEADLIREGVQRVLEERTEERKRRRGRAALERLTSLTADLPEVDAEQLVREGREELEHRLDYLWQS